jgi:hypothetical protein
VNAELSARRVVLRSPVLPPAFFHMTNCTAPGAVQGPTSREGARRQAYSANTVFVI